MDLNKNEYSQLEELKKQLLQKQNQIDDLQMQIKAVYSSTSWFVSKPVRLIGNIIRKILPKKVKTALKILKNGGIKSFFYVIKIKVRGENNTCNTQTDYKSEQFFSEIQETNIKKISIAVHIHLYYEDLLDEFISYLQNIPYCFDLYVSCRNNVDIKKIRRELKNIRLVKKIVVKNVENRGRDILPFYVTFGKRLKKYKYIMHAHSKKSLYTGREQLDWRQNSMNSICGSQMLVKKILYLFETENIGLVYPENYDNVPSIAYSWLMNESCGRDLLSRMGIPLPKGPFLFPAGSFFWARTDAIKPIFNLNLSRKDFPDEAKQNDGTIAHALERVIGITARHSGFNDALIDIRNNKIRKVFSPLPFMQLYVQTEENVFQLFMRYEVISFDIFDTLITRLCYEPDDLFEIMSKKIETLYGKAVDYLKIRKAAEALAWEEKKAYTNINDIYNKIPFVSDFTADEAEKLKCIEIELEMELAVPRMSMRNIFNRLKQEGKKIILVSDMYLTKDIITKILNKCGYSGWESMYISCEVGLRKDADTIWNMIFDIYDKNKFIHCGDNWRSDGQAVGDRGGAVMAILNPRDELVISPYRDLFNNIKKSVYNSLLLGCAINAGAFNSPFALSPNTFDLEFSSMENISYCVFAPLFIHYMNYLSLVPKKEEILLFLAREGYILMPLYEEWCKNRNIQLNRHNYFLASRRAAAVASISNESDIQNILFNNQYIGPERMLFLNRLGIDLGDNKNIDTLNLSPSEKDNILQLIHNNFGKIINQVNTESENYKNYFDSIVKKEERKNVSLVDIGYSGSIQLYLSKMLEEKLGGYYFASLANKPQSYGCAYNSLYPCGCDFSSQIQKIQLFLEIVLQAPQGQLINFIEKNGESIPQFRCPEKVASEVIIIQKEIFNAVSNVALILKDVYLDADEKNPLPKLFAQTFLKKELMPKSFIDNLIVEDNYCRNGTIKYNINNNTWEKIN